MKWICTLVAVAALGACGNAVTLDCGSSAIDCGGFCADTSVDPNNCGGCGVSCGGDECIDGACLTVACVPDNDPCNVDGDCCSLFCATDGNCGCIDSGGGFCNTDSDCCSNACDQNTGICN
jgi:hypothetical protein